VMGGYPVAGRGVGGVVEVDFPGLLRSWSCVRCWRVSGGVADRGLNGRGLVRIISEGAGKRGVKT